MSAKLIDLMLLLAENKQAIIDLGGVDALQSLVRSPNDRICQQATRALVNLGVNMVD